MDGTQKPPETHKPTQEPGSVIADRYRLERLIEKGGMGEVYVGTHLGLGKKVAVKVLLPKYKEYKEQVMRFLYEARGIADIRHRNVVNVMDVGTTQDGLPFFVMELLEGETLKERLKTEDRLGFPVIAVIMTQVLSGLSTLHKKKIIHRDMKPSNVFLSRDEDGTEVVKILDFGVSKFHILEQETSTDLTSTGAILGTPSYMSPEQARGFVKEIDQRTDTYACGLIFYRALTGINPFKGDNYNEVIGNILALQVPPPSFFVPGTPARVDRLVLKAISRRKEDRFQDCESFIEALDRIEGSVAENVRRREPQESTDILYPSLAKKKERPRAGAAAAQSAKASSAGASSGEAAEILDIPFTEEPESSDDEGSAQVTDTLLEAAGRKTSRTVALVALGALIFLVPAGALVYWSVKKGAEPAGDERKTGPEKIHEAAVPVFLDEAPDDAASAEAPADLPEGGGASEPADIEQEADAPEEKLDEGPSPDQTAAKTRTGKKKPKIDKGLIEEFPREKSKKGLITEFPKE
jgi:serine/threonine protein kinase